ncbi:MAG: AAA family ATPase [Pseudoclavibacter sp.]|nr:AAA family ATPase [Pseudoclavibacter sp.]
MHEEAIETLRGLLARSPDQATLRVTLAELLAADGRDAEAAAEAGRALVHAPGDARALAVLTAAAGRLGPATPQADAPPQTETPPQAGTGRPADPAPSETAGPEAEFDWSRAERSLAQDIQPPFISSPAPAPGSAPDPTAERMRIREGEAGPPGVPWEPGARTITFDDVGGLEDVKKRLDESFIQPMRHADIARAFGKSLRGGLLLYGPPGCGKTHIARAVAGQMGVAFRSLLVTDVVDSYRGETEKNIHAVFEELRALRAPTVLFLDEIDAIAIRRTALSGSSSWMRSAVNQLLLEMDSMESDEHGLYILAASNHPWDIDDAFLRPGRLDRAVLVPPPDGPAREAILRAHLSARPIAGVDLGELVAATAGFSGADLEHLAVSAAEKAMTESISHGRVTPISMPQLRAALAEIRPSTGEWMQSARNVVRYANQSGRYDDLQDYLSRDEGRGGAAKKKRR